MSRLALSQLRSLANGLDHPEGVALGPDEMLYAGGEAGQVYRIDPNGGGHEQTRLARSISAMAATPP
jgi:uncharacterized protein YjiK